MTQKKKYFTGVKVIGTRISFLVRIWRFEKIEVYADKMEGNQVVTFSTESGLSVSIAKAIIRSVRAAALTCFRVLDHTKEYVDGVTVEGGVGENQVYLNNLSFVVGFGSAWGKALHEAGLRPQCLHVEALANPGTTMGQALDEWIYSLRS